MSRPQKGGSAGKGPYVGAAVPQLGALLAPSANVLAQFDHDPLASSIWSLVVEQQLVVQTQIIHLLPLGRVQHGEHRRNQIHRTFGIPIPVHQAQNEPRLDDNAWHDLSPIIMQCSLPEQALQASG
ncbi:hypothetical protein F5B20DRAFT_576562 [Whalleya microplaca]|nr:hypothetical protein F5B20DRAFT_576562 [Whalleya microplaca]